MFRTNFSIRKKASNFCKENQLTNKSQQSLHKTPSKVSSYTSNPFKKSKFKLSQQNYGHLVKIINSITEVWKMVTALGTEISE